MNIYNFLQGWQLTCIRRIGLICAPITNAPATLQAKFQDRYG